MCRQPTTIDTCLSICEKQQLVGRSAVRLVSRVSPARRTAITETSFPSALLISVHHRHPSSSSFIIIIIIVSRVTMDVVDR